MLHRFIAKASTKRLKTFDKKANSENLRITLCNVNSEGAIALAEAFFHEPNIEVIQGNALTLKADAIVSPANSFGDMGGGIDKVIDDFFKGEAQRKTMEKIRADFLGELPVGMALIIPMNNKRIPNLIVAPTMRIPGNVKGTINAYLAMRAILVSLFKYNAYQEIKIKHIIIPSLCTGVGRMPYRESAPQMFKAYQNIVLGEWKDVAHPAMAPYVLRKQNRQ